MKILFTTPLLAHPPVGGPFLRIENSIKALAKISQLHIFCRRSIFDIGGNSAVKYYNKYCESFTFAPSFSSTNKYTRFVKRGCNFLGRMMLRRNIFPYPTDIPDIDYKSLLQLANSIKADIIWLGYGNISYPLLKYIKENSDYKVVVDTDSVWSRFVLRGLPYATDEKDRNRILVEGKAKEQEECWGTAMADVTTAVSEIDAQYYRSLVADSSKIHIFSNVIDVGMYERNIPKPDNFKKPCIYLAGTFWSQSPMEDSALWLINGVMPILRVNVPGIHLYILGNGSRETLNAITDPDVSVLGRVQSVLPYLKNAGVAVVPLRYESGTRFKILESGASGVPVVSTTLGAEGIPVTDGYDILIADDPELFAKHIIRVLQDQDLGDRLASNLKKLVVENYSIETLAVEGLQILDYLSGLKTVTTYHDLFTG